MYFVLISKADNIVFLMITVTCRLIYYCLKVTRGGYILQARCGSDIFTDD